VQHKKADQKQYGCDREKETVGTCGGMIEQAIFEKKLQSYNDIP
jgi:hypothetical protein